MTPYASFTYFGVLLYVILPAVATGPFPGLRRAVILVATLGMLVVEYGNEAPAWADGPSVRGLWVVLGFALMQWAIAWSFLKARSRTDRRGAYPVALICSLLPLVASRLADAGGSTWLAGFVGLSYATFRALDVVICIQDRVVRDLSFGRYLLFLLFFPTISAGPIDRYRRFVADLDRQRARAEFGADLDAAVHLVMTGFALKFVAAELIRRFWLEPTAAVDGTGGPLA